MCILAKFRVCESNHIAGGIEGCVWLTECFDDAFATSIGRTKVDEQDLVQIVMNDLCQFCPALNQFGIGQLAFEDAVLQVIAPVPQGLVDFAESFIVTDIVGNDE